MLRFAFSKTTTSCGRSPQPENDARLAKLWRTELLYGVMAVRTCAVSFTDSRGSLHTVEVSAESLFEAAVLGGCGSTRAPPRTAKAACS